MYQKLPEPIDTNVITIYPLLFFVATSVHNLALTRATTCMQPLVLTARAHICILHHYTRQVHTVITIYSFIHSCVHSCNSFTWILRAHAHVSLSSDVKRPRSLYDEDSLDGDRPYENEGINVFKGTVQTIPLFLFRLFLFRQY